jgi:hypothetical protein
VVVPVVMMTVAVPMTAMVVVVRVLHRVALVCRGDLQGGAIIFSERRRR